jgi:tRNA C32,U32 (ribose-2'-O)-methylase TrmJ
VQSVHQVGQVPVEEHVQAPENRHAACAEEICAEMKARSEAGMTGLLGHTEEALVSTDLAQRADAAELARQMAAAASQGTASERDIGRWRHVVRRLRKWTALRQLCEEG